MSNAIVTGATGGVGRPVVLTLAKKGWNVIACGRNPEKIATLASIENILGHADDLTRKGAPSTLVRLAEHTFDGHIDCLIHCAGFAAHAPIDELNQAELDQTMSVNVTLPILLTRESLPLMARSQAPRIIFIGSILSDTTMANTATYTASKHALNGFVRSLRLECGSWLRVSQVEPGAIETPFLNNTVNQTALNEFEQRRLERLPAAAIADVVMLIALEADPNVVIERVVMVPFGQHKRNVTG
jgi:NAD(P)-dependent dehydrogenase (short-subunit alcohol dehydrogenase family)